MRTFILFFLFLFSCIEERDLSKDIKLINADVNPISSFNIPDWLTEKHKEFVRKNSKGFMMNNESIQLPTNHPLLKEIKEGISDRLNIILIYIRFMAEKIFCYYPIQFLIDEGHFLFFNENDKSFYEKLLPKIKWVLFDHKEPSVINEKSDYFNRKDLLLPREIRHGTIDKKKYEILFNEETEKLTSIIKESSICLDPLVYNLKSLIQNLQGYERKYPNEKELIDGFKKANEEFLISYEGAKKQRLVTKELKDQISKLRESLLKITFHKNDENHNRVMLIIEILDELIQRLWNYPNNGESIGNMDVTQFSQEEEPKQGIWWNGNFIEGTWIDPINYIFINKPNNQLYQYIDGYWHPIGIILNENGLYQNKKGVIYQYIGDSKWEDEKGAVWQFINGNWNHLGMWLEKKANVFLRTNKIVSKLINDIWHDIGIWEDENRSIQGTNGITYQYIGDDKWKDINNGMTHRYMDKWCHLGTWINQEEGLRADVNGIIYQYRNDDTWQKAVYHNINLRVNGRTLPLRGIWMNKKTKFFDVNNNGLYKYVEKDNWKVEGLWVNNAEGTLQLICF